MTTLPYELQLVIIEIADWTQLPTLYDVCQIWRDYIRNFVNTRFLPDRYTYQRLPLDIRNRPRQDPPWHFHRVLRYITHVIYIDGEFHFAHLEFNGQNVQQPVVQQQPGQQAGPQTGQPTVGQLGNLLQQLRQLSGQQTRQNFRQQFMQHVRQQSIQYARQQAIRQAIQQAGQQIGQQVRRQTGQQTEQQARQQTGQQARQQARREEEVPWWATSPFTTEIGSGFPAPGAAQSDAIPPMQTLNMRLFFDDPLITPYRNPSPVMTPIPPGALATSLPTRIPYYRPLHTGSSIIEEYTIPFSQLYSQELISPSSGLRLLTQLLLRRVHMATRWPVLVDDMGRRRGLIKVDVMYRVCGNGTVGITFRNRSVGWAELNRATEIVRLKFR
ncbi:hypothetical protein TWF506_005905 [Arthrobotrys conoides]|uniref:F-box domain-containing protein n=1 Tax=Arthrobotrys conoides TaxID=74498 RepID=A0AAN8NXF8_9PEZI